MFRQRGGRENFLPDVQAHTEPPDAVHSYANSLDWADGGTWVSGYAVNRWSRTPTRRWLQCRP